MSDQTQALYHDSSEIKDVFHFQWALFESATDIAVERWFSQEEVDEIVGFVVSLSIWADPKGFGNP
jgi:hypothetical protein